MGECDSDRDSIFKSVFDTAVALLIPKCITTCTSIFYTESVVLTHNNDLATRTPSYLRVSTGLDPRGWFAGLYYIDFFMKCVLVAELELWFCVSSGNSKRITRISSYIDSKLVIY